MKGGISSADLFNRPACGRDSLHRITPRPVLGPWVWGGGKAFPPTSAHSTGPRPEDSAPAYESSPGKDGSLHPPGTTRPRGQPPGIPSHVRRIRSRSPDPGPQGCAPGARGKLPVPKRHSGTALVGSSGSCQVGSGSPTSSGGIIRTPVPALLSAGPGLRTGEPLAIRHPEKEQ